MSEGVEKEVGGVEMQTKVETDVPVAPAVAAVEEGAEEAAGTAVQADKVETEATEATKATEVTETTEATEVAASSSSARQLLKSDDELLMKHYPRYFYDKGEKILPVDLNKYTVDKSAADGCNAVATTSTDGNHTWLMYMNYYLRDGGVPALGGIGGHAYDLEIVIVELYKSTQEITGIFYGPHGSHEHMWIRDVDDLKELIDETGRPEVYVSLGKHASYPVCGLVLRLFGAGTDACLFPTARDRPLFLLDQSTQDVNKIDGVFSGPKTKIDRDWSTAPVIRLSKVRGRLAVPPPAQVVNKLDKLKFWEKK